MSMTQVIGESAKSARRRGPGRKRRPAAGAGRRWWPGDGADARESYLVLLPPEDGAPMTAGRARRRGEELGGRLATRLRSEFGVRVDVRRAGDPPEGSSEERAEELRRHPKLVRVVAFAGLNAVWVDGTPAIGMFLRRGRRQREEAVVRSPQMVICRSPGAGGESTESHGVPDGQWAKEVGDQHRWHLAHPEAGVGAAGKEVGDGAGIVVGFLDTGINASHPEFVGKRVWYKRIGRDGGYVGGAAADPDGHGTFCASLACGRDCGSAPKADVAMAAAPLGALDSPGQIAQQVLTGVDFLMTLDRGGNEDDAPVGVDVLNFSLFHLNGRSLRL